MPTTLAVHRHLGLTMTPLPLSLVTAAALAGTPDGLTPAVETVCDVYAGDGAAFGLCNAYCEAMDCDDPLVHASNNACEAVAKNFTKQTGEAYLPCDAPVSCAVVAEDEFYDLYDPGLYEIDVLANDTVSPASSPVWIEDFSPVDGVSLLDGDAGLFEVLWDEDDTSVYIVFEYTACCSPTSCDTATVTLLGS